MGEKDSGVNLELFERIDSCVKEHKLYLDPYINLNELARKVGSNRSYVSMTISKFAGGFSEYLNEYRVKEMQNILEERDPNRGEVDVKDLAVLSGFSSYRHMSTYMKKRKK